ETNEQLEILFGELIEYPEADSASGETTPLFQLSPVNPIGGANNPTTEPLTQNESQGVALHRESLAQYQPSESPTVSSLSPTYYAANYVPPWSDYYTAVPSYYPQGPSNHSSTPMPYTEDPE
ncbi:hypothetical protein FRC06_004290, partial [Ceratobasidium sp. 370]